MSSMGLRFVLLMVCVHWSVNAFAAAALRDSVDLIELLKRQPACCVIDARSEAKRVKESLPGTLVYRPDLRITPTATVIVVADDNQTAMKVANTLASQYPGKNIYAVRGGASSWQFVRSSVDKVNASTGAAPAGVSFVIPHNTCETGTPLQVLSSDKKAKP